MEGMYLIRTNAIGFDRAMARGACLTISPRSQVRTINVDRLQQSPVRGCLLARAAEFQLVPP